MGELNSKTGLLKTQKHELVKQYLVLDGSDRVSKIYTAPTDAVTGTPCEVTEYIYYLTTTIVIGRKEGKATWDASWIDSSFTVTT